MTEEEEKGSTSRKATTESNNQEILTKLDVCSRDFALGAKVNSDEFSLHSKKEVGGKH